MKQLPKEVNPFLLARQQTSLVGMVRIKELARLRDLVLNPDSEVAVELNFDRNPKHLTIVSGEIGVKVALKCQRCQQPVTYDLQLKPKLSPIQSDQMAKNLPSKVDPLLIEGDLVNLMDLVEEEIILNFPMVARHTQGACPVELPNYLH